MCSERGQSPGEGVDSVQRQRVGEALGSSGLVGCTRPGRSSRADTWEDQLPST